MSTFRTGPGSLPISIAGCERAPSLLYQVATSLALHYATAGRKTFLGGKETEKHARCTLNHPAFQGSPAGAVIPTWRSGAEQGTRRAASRGAVTEGSRRATVQTPRRGRSVSPPPPAQLWARRRRPRGQLRQGRGSNAASNRLCERKERLSESACQQGCLSFPLPSPGGPSSPEEDTGTPPRSPRWPLRHEASAQPPRSSRERGGAREAGGRSCSPDWP